MVIIEVENMMFGLVLKIEYHRNKDTIGDEEHEKV